MVLAEEKVHASGRCPGKGGGTRERKRESRNNKCCYQDGGRTQKGWERAREAGSRGWGEEREEQEDEDEVDVLEIMGCQAGKREREEDELSEKEEGNTNYHCGSGE